MSDSSDKTVFFFGAGASFASDFELPVMKDFFREKDFKTGSYKNLERFIKEKFKHEDFTSLNLEEVVTFIELSLDTFGSFGKYPDSYIYEARREFGEYVNMRLKISNLKGCKNHEKIIGQDIAGVNSMNSIISLNYDLVIDNTLYVNSPRLSKRKNDLDHRCLLNRMYNLLAKTKLFHGERASLYPKDEEFGFYLKLHGSVDWIYCPNINCDNHQIFFPNWLGSNEVHNKPGDLCSLCGSPLVNVIVPPTMHKTFEKFPKLGLLWSLAYRELYKANKIVFFGVSFAPSDYYLRWLVSKAINEREDKPVIININTDSSISDEIERITGIKSVYRENLDKFIEDS